jgi:hypothetical protein
LFAVLALAASPALAQETAQPAAAGPTKAKRTVVVVADPFDDETENAKLRAKVFDACRERGYDPDGKADVRAAAEQNDAMIDGRVTADAGPLEAVRKALGATVLVRISKQEGGVRVSVVKDGAEKRKDVVDAAAALSAVEELLGGAPKPAAAPAAAASPTPTGASASGSTSQGISAGFILPQKKRDDEPDYGDPKVLAGAWQDRGGVRVAYGAHAMATGLIIPKTLYASQNPETNQLDVGSATTYGVGLGLGLDLSVMYLPLPDPRSGSTSWQAFRLGVRAEASGLYVRPPLKYTYRTDGTTGAVLSRDTKYDNGAYIYGVLPFQLGVHFGFGDFRAPTLWRGFALGLAYSPAFIFTLKVGEKEDAAESRFNYGGFEVSADIVKLEAGGGSQPQIRLSALVLPRVNDELPWLASFGVGAVWY